MSEPGDREFPKSTWGAVFLLAWTAGLSAFSLLLGLAVALVSTSAADFMASGLGFCAVVLILAIVGGRYAVRLVRAWKVPVLVIDIAGIHTPRNSKSVAWADIETVEIFDNDGMIYLKLTPGNAHREPWWQRPHGATELDIGLAKGPYSAIVDAVRAHPNYRGH